MKVNSFPLSELISFGNYLLSEERTEQKMRNENISREQIDASIKEVSHADIENWASEQKIEIDE